MYQLDEKKIDIFVKACHEVAAYGLVACSTGNLSWRIDGNIILISASQSWLGEITAEQVAVYKMNEGACINGVKPSKEIGIHLGILKRKSDANVVLHCHSPYATMLACSKRMNYNFNVIAEIPYYIGSINVIERYYMPGSVELAEAVIKAVKDSGMVLLRNHGQIIFGKDFKDTLQKAVFFEQACQIILANPKINPLSADEVEKLRDMKVKSDSEQSSRSK